MTEPKILWKPSPKQEEFLSCPDEEVLYGGAAGGGKTDAMLIDALGLWQNAPLNPRYRALILRRTFPELRDLIDRSRVIYPAIIPGAKYNGADHEWKFPSGAKLIFGYAAQDSDRFQFQGQEYQYIGFEELTQWATDRIYTYLWSRLRTSDPNLKCLVRATCNPGGIGHTWVMERWRIPADGSATSFAIEVTLEDDQGNEVVKRIRRRFIPARVGDNPHVGLDYRANLAQLPENERKALLGGRWDVIEIPGQIYKNELEKLFVDGRLGRVPYDPMLPVHTGWDLGVSDSTTIWFAQRVANEFRIIDYYEASGEGLPHYAQVLQSKGYVYGKHIAPHDIAVRELGSGKSRIEIAKQLGINFEIAPNLPLEDGINAVRLQLSTMWFDEQKTKAGFNGIKHYRRDYNQKLGEFKATPVHDWASHAADGLRYLVLGLKQEAPKTAARLPTNHQYGSHGWMG
jgi:hypothetical protein